MIVKYLYFILDVRNHDIYASRDDNMDERQIRKKTDKKANVERKNI